MKILKIQNNKGYFLTGDGEYESIDSISKEDLLSLVDKILDDDVEMDEFDVEALANQAHQVIYKSIYTKLASLQSRKSEFTDESQRLFLEDYQRYTNPASTETSES